MQQATKGKRRTGQHPALRFARFAACKSHIEFESRELTQGEGFCELSGLAQHTSPLNHIGAFTNQRQLKTTSDCRQVHLFVTQCTVATVLDCAGVRV